jgi:aspartyl-tRNA(Asn)/glutamyl-tRNA(Gln) amidotransferase subunit C
MANKLTDEDVKKLASLSSLNLSADQIKSLKPQLNDILDYVGQLSELNLKAIETTAQVTGLKSITAEDIAREGLSVEAAVSQANNHQGYVVVPAVLSEEADA